MNEQLWSGHGHAPAVCPECSAPALHRSRAKTIIERARKRYSRKRIFHCRACDWRGWIEETRLRYPIAELPRDPFMPAPANDDIPAVDIMPRDAVGRGRQDSGPSREIEVSAAFSIDFRDFGAAPGNEIPPETDLEEFGTDPRPVPDLTEEARIPSRQFDFDESMMEDRPTPTYSAVSEHYHSSPSLPNFCCPACGATALRRSHHRNIFEAIRKRITNSRAYRCHRCGWRGWVTTPYAQF